MLRLNRLTTLLLACCCSIPSLAHTFNCSADFVYSVADYKIVDFFAIDSLAASHHWLWGDGTAVTNSPEATIAHQYAQPGKYEVKHIIERPGSNCRDTIIKTITVEWREPCAARYYYQRDTGTLSFYFFNSSSAGSGIKKINWDFGDGTSSDSENPVHQFAKQGIYNVCLKIEATSGCSSEYCSQLNLKDTTGICNLAPQFQYQKDPGTCKKIYFSNSSALSNANTHFTWTFGDGSSSHEINPVHIYAATGRYKVCLVAEADSNCRKEYCSEVVVECDSCGIPPAFAYSKDSLNCKKINFLNHSIPVSSNTHYTWNFGDGSSSHDINPSHVYKQTGQYMVCLVSETGSSCRQQYCDTITVRCGDSCNIQPAFTWHREPAAPNKILFNNSSTGTPGNVHYLWSFGDNSSSADKNPVHVYAHTGKYNVCLVASGGDACRKEICQQVEITTCNTTAGFETRNDTVQWNRLYFANVSKPVTTIWQTYWTYGDGTSSQDFNSFHSYDKPGVYNVCLKVIALSGCISYYCDTVRVIKKDSCATRANFNHYSSSPTSLTIKFEALYQSNAAQYNWNFGDSTVGAGRLAYHAYKKAGKYTACLTVKEGNCSTTWCKDVTIEKSDTGNRITLFPNPVISAVSIELAPDRPSQLYIRFLDGSGASKSAFSINAVAGKNRITLPAEKLSQGIYLVEIKSSTGTWYRRFIKG